MADAVSVTVNFITFHNGRPLPLLCWLNRVIAHFESAGEGGSPMVIWPLLTHLLSISDPSFSSSLGSSYGFAERWTSGGCTMVAGATYIELFNVFHRVRSYLDPIFDTPLCTKRYLATADVPRHPPWKDGEEDVVWELNSLLTCGS